MHGAEGMLVRTEAAECEWLGVTSICWTCVAHVDRRDLSRRLREERSSHSGKKHSPTCCAIPLTATLRTHVGRTGDRKERFEAFSWTL